MKDVIDDVDRWIERGDKVALATVVGVRRSAPRPPGAKMAINDRGEGPVRRRRSRRGGAPQGVPRRRALRMESEPRDRSAISLRWTEAIRKAIYANYNLEDTLARNFVYRPQK